MQYCIVSCVVLCYSSYIRVFYRCELGLTSDDGFVCEADERRATLMMLADDDVCK